MSAGDPFATLLHRFTAAVEAGDGARFATRFTEISRCTKTVNGGLGMVQIGIGAARIEKVLHRWARELRERPAAPAHLNRARQARP